MSSEQLKKLFSSSKFKAKPYRTTVEDCIRWTELLNHIIFDGKVPPYREIVIKRLRGQYAYCAWDQNNGDPYCDLVIKPRFDSFLAFYCILIHELIHAAEFFDMGTCGHGKYFYSHKEIAHLLGVKLKKAY